MENKNYYKSSSWQNLRKIKLTENNYCVNCACFGIQENANEVHHILKPAEQDSKEEELLFFDKENLVCLCKRDHRSLHGSRKYIHPRFEEWLKEMKNYLCYKYYKDGIIVRYTNDKNKRKL